MAQSANHTNKYKIATVVTAICLLMLVAGAADAQQEQKALEGHVKKTDAPSRLARPPLPGGVNETRLAPAVDASAFELKQSGPPKFEEWHPFADLSINSTRARPTIQSPLTPNPTPQSTPAATPPQEANVEQSDPFARELELISKYNVMLLVDQSGSMGIDDCNGRSRWSWCEEETRNFATIASRVIPQGIDLTLFNQHYRDLGAVRPEELHRIFINYHPYGGTILGSPIVHLVERLVYARKTGDNKPAILAVITDGEPVDRQQVEEILVNITKQVPQNFVKVVFLKVGEGAMGDEYIRNLDNNLYGKGAAYDIVDSRDFSYLRGYGLLRTLCDTVQK